MSRGEDGKMATYRVEFFFIGTRDKLVIDSWEAEEWKCPDLTATDYMERANYDFQSFDLESGIIVTLFIEGKPVSSVLWHGYGTENISEIFEVERDE